MPWHPPEGHGWAVVYPLLRDVFLSLGLLSLGSCAAVVLFYRALPQVRRTPGWLVQRATLCEALVSACFVALFFFGALLGGPLILQEIDSTGIPLDAAILRPILSSPVETFCIAAAGALSSSAFVLPVLKAKGWEERPEAALEAARRSEKAAPFV